MWLLTSICFVICSGFLRDFIIAEIYPDYLYKMWIEMNKLFAMYVTSITTIPLTWWIATVTFFQKYIKKASKIVVTHQIIGLGEKVLDILMIYLLIKYPVYVAFVVVTLLYYAYTLFVVMAYDYFLAKGYDLLELENLKKHGADPESSKLLQWILKRRTTIFMVGSCCQLDPDGVTILLRKDRNFWKNAFMITLPSVIVCMVWWTTVLKLGLMGVGLFPWFLQ